MSDDKKLTLSSNTLGVNKGGDSGGARPNFSGGRGKAVVVERKKKRVLKKGPASEKKSAPTPKTQSFQVKKPQSEQGTDTNLTNKELEARVAALESAKKADQEKKK